MVVAALVLASSPAGAETLAEALASAYANNPTLNAQRAALRATDEGVPQALSGYRPTVNGTATAGVSDTNGKSTYPTSVSISVVQPIFTGFQTKNSVKMAETAVLAGRETLRTTEQTVLLSAVSAFMDLVKAQANLNLQKQNVDFLGQQLNAANDRLKVGEGTRTDVAQTNARLAAGQSQYDAGVAQVNAAVATYEQIVGHRPRSLGTAKPVDFMLPRSPRRGADSVADRQPVDSGVRLQYRRCVVQCERPGRLAPAERFGDRQPDPRRQRRRLFGDVGYGVAGRQAHGADLHRAA